MALMTKTDKQGSPHDATTETHPPPTRPVTGSSTQQRPSEPHRTAELPRRTGPKRPRAPPRPPPASLGLPPASLSPSPIVPALSHRETVINSSFRRQSLRTSTSARPPAGHPTRCQTTRAAPSRHHPPRRRTLCGPLPRQPPPCPPLVSGPPPHRHRPPTLSSPPHVSYKSPNLAQPLPPRWRTDAPFLLRFVLLFASAPLPHLFHPPSAHLGPAPSLYRRSEYSAPRDLPFSYALLSNGFRIQSNAFRRAALPYRPSCTISNEHHHKRSPRAPLVPLHCRFLPGTSFAPPSSWKIPREPLQCAFSTPSLVAVPHLWQPDYWACPPWRTSPIPSLQRLARQRPIATGIGTTSPRIHAALLEGISRRHTQDPELSEPALAFLTKMFQKDALLSLCSARQALAGRRLRCQSTRSPRFIPYSGLLLSRRYRRHL